MISLEHWNALKLKEIKERNLRRYRSRLNNIECPSCGAELKDITTYNTTPIKVKVGCSHCKFTGTRLE